ncbi:MAG: hypothetical protein ACXADS_14755 [Candidatus Thorarchaeota archaeon]
MPGLSLIPLASPHLPRLLFGAYGTEPITAIVYGINRFLGLLELWALWLCATTKRRLVGAYVEPAPMKGEGRMAIAYLVAILGALGVVFVNPLISSVMYLLILAAVSILTANG